MIQLKEGMKAPEFEGIDQNGRTVKLSGLRGKKVVLYFYPKDDTMTCTTEACNLRDNHTELIKKGFVVIGVSPDSEKSHQKFIKKYALPFSLISDASHTIINDYGVWGEKKLFGVLTIGVIRTTFIIDEKGIIEKIIANVKSSSHASQIFEAYNH